MKTTAYTLFCVLFFTAFMGFVPQTGSNYNEADDGDGRIEVLFTRNTDLNELASIKQDLADKGIALDYRKIEFDIYGDLISLYFTVDCKDGFSGSAENASLTNQSKFGFYRDYSTKAVSPFGVGNLE